MLKTRRYPNTRFRSHVFAEADQAIRSIFPLDTQLPQSAQFKVWLRDEFYKFDTVEEFLSAVEQGLSLYHRDCGRRWGLEVLTFQTLVHVDVWAPTRSEVSRVSAVFEKYAPESKLSETLLKDRPMIFIGHRADLQWQDLKNELHEQQGYEVAEYPIGHRGLALQTVLDELVLGHSVAVIIMAAEDERENVIYEAGAFVGKLGFGRVIVLLEEGTKEFSDMVGIYQIRFAKGRLREAAADLIAIVKKFES